ncbi:proline dehydrogenase family protein [Mesobacillus maritimus]|uniref:proline dehydrogenase family protein n=1 Tax=Mesobacillus maritimus TaxID=1643336 RepID=UPI003850749E
MERWLRNFFLFLSNNRMITRLAKKYGFHLGASRFVAGKNIEEAVIVIKELNKKGLAVTLDFLGEFVESEGEARDRVNQSIKAIEFIRRENLDAQLSVKLTSMGLDISEDLVLENMRRILRIAKWNDVFVTIDMEDYSRYEKTLNIFKQLRSESEHIGTVLQAYLYRAEQDLRELHEYEPHFRLVKGAYKESVEVAYQNKKDVDDQLKKLIKIHLLSGHYTAVASHDDKIIEYTKKVVKEHDIPFEQFEFQMLYGIRPECHEKLKDEGYTMRVYVPYGTDWFGYFMRRLAERPANLQFLLKGLFKF